MLNAVERFNLLIISHEIFDKKIINYYTHQVHVHEVGFKMQLSHTVLHTKFNAVTGSKDAHSQFETIQA